MFIGVPLKQTARSTRTLKFSTPNKIRVQPTPKKIVKAKRQTPCYCLALTENLFVL